MTDFEQNAWYSSNNYCEIGDFCGWMFGPTYAPNTSKRPILSIMKPFVNPHLSSYCAVAPTTSAALSSIYSEAVVDRNVDHGRWKTNGGRNREFSTPTKRALDSTDYSVGTAAADSTAAFIFSSNWTIALSNATTIKYFALQLQYQPNVGCVNQHIRLKRKNK